MTELEKIATQISKIVSNFDFPLSVVQDVEKRLNDCQDIGYANQQLRYLKNVKHSMLEKRK